MTTPRTLSDRYELGETLGFGGMSEVHLARDIRLSRDVAIKVLRADLARDPSFYLRFRREAQNAASLNHPSIVQVYDTGESETDAGPLPFIVMEYVDGETLRDVLRRDVFLAPQKAMTAMVDVCGALDFSHKNGIVHRDVKPANVMVTRAGEIKVMDFGIARAMSDASASMTQTAAVIGTAQYLSPEQARGEAVDARSDVYSAGCVLFELVTGEPPFSGDSPVSVAYQHVREDPRTPSAVRRGVPAEVDSIVLKAMSKNPANRYQSAGDMRNDLTRVLAGRRPEAPMVMSDDERTAMFASDPVRRRSRHASAVAASTSATQELDSAASNGAGGATAVGAAAAGGAAAAAGGGTAGGGAGASRPTPQRVTSRRHKPEKKSRLARIAFIAASAIIALILVVGVALYLKPGRTEAPTLVTIPAVANQGVADAQVALQKLDFQVEVRRVANNDVPADRVVSSTPAAGTQVNQGTEVILTVSSGPRTAKVPDVRGRNQQQATALLQAAGFRVSPNVLRAVSSAEQENQVTLTNPRAGDTAAVTQPVVLTIGTGPAQVRIPDVTGQTEDQARANLTGYGFTVTSTEVDSDQPKGIVVAQTPTGGTDADNGSAVTLSVSKGVPNIAVPGDVVGKTLTAARAQLTAAGFTNITVDRSVPAGFAWDRNKVWGISPAGGNQVPADTEIVLRVWN